MPRLDLALRSPPYWPLPVRYASIPLERELANLHPVGWSNSRSKRFPEKPDSPTHKRKVVVMVHGTDGLQNFGGELRSFAKDLASRGYLAVLPNYFGKSDAATKTGTPNEQVNRLSDAIKWLRTCPMPTRAYRPDRLLTRGGNWPSVMPRRIRRGQADCGQLRAY